MKCATGGGRRAGKDVYKTIHIKEKCWIGAEVLILPGVTIGKGCVVAAGAIVTTDVEENTMVAGVPARISNATFLTFSEVLQQIPTAIYLGRDSST